MLLLAMFCAGVALALLERRADESSELKRFVDKSVTLTGVLDGPPEFARDRLYLSLRVERVDAEAIARDASRCWRRFGMRQRQKLSEHYNFAMALVSASEQLSIARATIAIPVSRRCSEYLDRRGYDATGIVRGPGSIARLEDTRVFPLSGQTL